MFKRINKLVSMIMLLGLLLISAAPNGSISAKGTQPLLSAALHPTSIVTTRGAATGALASLLVKDQLGTVDTPTKYVLFRTPLVTYQGYRTYTVPLSVSPGAVTGVTVTANYKGPAKVSQTWTWNLYDWVAGTWVKAGDNTGAIANTWKTLTFNLTSNASRFINNTTRQIRVQLTSNNAAYDAKLDYEALTLTYTACADPLGCVAVRPGAQIHIAYYLNIPSLESKNGVGVAIDAAGGAILSHTIQFDGIARANCDNALAQTDAAKMTIDASIVAVIGTTCSGEAKMAMPVFSAKGFSMISPSNTFSGLTESGSPDQHPGYFRVSWSDANQGTVAAQYAKTTLGLTKAATINDGSSYSIALEQAFVDEFTALGGTITTQQTVTLDQMDMTAVLTTIASGAPDMIYFPIFMPAGSYIINQARATAGLETVYLMAADGLLLQDVVFSTGPDVNGFLVTAGPDTAQFSPNYASSFVPAYTTKYGTAPSDPAFSAYGYDAFNITKAAIESAAVVQLDGSLLIGRQALRDALYATSGFAGLTGTLTCSPTGACADPALAVYQYHTGVLDPTKIWP